MILGIYLLVSFICLIWLTAYLFVFRAGGGEQAAGVRREPAAEPRGSLRPVRGKLALVIDDAGYDGDFLDAFLSFPGPMAVSVLPGLAGSGEAARKIRNAGKDLMLHLPMEPAGSQDPGPGAIYVNMKDDAVLRLVGAHLAALPGAIGVNNHMGSKATADERIMRLVLGALKDGKRFFLDSGTTALSAGRRVAMDLKIPFLERSVFLDNEKDKSSILEAIGKGKAAADKRGYAVMIGHVWCSELAEVLLEVYPNILDEGYQFYPLADLLLGDDPGDDSRD